ncbi:MAG: VWA domain-containing protein [Candidatus Binatus sp.]|uniref:VWA domain-containing protein n=1 Tax=Candidatus Binatus sp. TaxID=2811406 RepID=UPI00271E3A17|nr:VWA domain-containing protein [Candidatus Binatus sp.]MDO8431881.1 VWA domain-containing protein [Candidatus Binatus sp.]
MLYLPVMLGRSNSEKQSDVKILVRMMVVVILAIALAGCAQTMEPVAMPLVQGPLNLCSSNPEPPPKDLASNPNYAEYSVEVIDPAGAPTNGLKESDFVVIEKGATVPIAFFREDHTRPPASIGILVDKSGSMVSKLPIVKSAVAELLKKIDSCDEVFLYAFGIDPVLVQDFTTDHDIVSARLNAVNAWGRTPLYDGVKLGIERLKGGHYPDKVLIVLTDDIPASWLESTGLDNASKNVTQEGLVSSALNSHSRIYVVGVGNPAASHVPIIIGPWDIGHSQEAIDTDSLKNFATNIGAVVFFILSPADKSAPKVSLEQRQPLGLFINPLKFSPLAIDANQIDQVATSIASQIDDHYTIGVITSAKSAPAPSTATEVKLANRPTAIASMHRVQLAPTP